MKSSFPKCIDCGKKLGRHNAKRCHSCEMKKRWKDKKWRINFNKKNSGENNSNYIHGRSLKKYYCKCGKEITWLAKRCQDCYHKFTSNENSSQWNKVI